jgi:hypothetical protein
VALIALRDVFGDRPVEVGHHGEFAALQGQTPADNPQLTGNSARGGTGQPMGE